uniref:Uncharacterized protein n=1 Tax=Alexandrium monilatum TaxID=311494 RepID=A0A7S4R5W1_9DINO
MQPPPAQQPRHMARVPSPPPDQRRAHVQHRPTLVGAATAPRAPSPPPGSQAVSANSSFVPPSASPTLSAASSFAPSVVTSPAAAAWRSIGQSGPGCVTGVMSPSRPRPGACSALPGMGSMAAVAMRMSWKTLATNEDIEAIDRTKPPQPPQRIRAISPPPAVCGPGSARGGAASPPPMIAGSCVGIGSLAAKVGPALQCPRPTVRPPSEVAVSSQSSLEDAECFRKKEVQEEIERSLQKAMEMLKMTKFQEAQSLPEEHQAVFAAFRRELESQQATLAEVVTQQLRACEFGKRMEADFDSAQQSQAMEYASMRVELEKHRAQWSALEDAVSRMQEEVCLQGSRCEQVEGMIKDFNGIADTLREDVVRSTSSLSGVVEDVSRAVAATERSLRQEMEETRRALERANSDQRTEISKDQQDLRLLVESICKDVAQLQATMAADRDAHASAAGMAQQASHCVQEVMATAGDRLGRLESSLMRLEAAEARRASGAVAHGSESGLATSQDVQDIWDVLSMLKASLEARESAVRAEADTQSLEAEAGPGAGYALASRVAALEEHSLTQKAASSRVGALIESLEKLLGECAAVGRSSERLETSPLQVCIATPMGSGEHSCRSPIADLSVSGSVKGELLRTVKACATAALGSEIDRMADPFRTPDLTPAAVARLPTPQAAVTAGRC